MLRGLLTLSRDRELAAALQEQREPDLRYPAIDVEAVRQRIAGFQMLDAEISEQEHNSIVRRLYHGAIEDELLFLRMIEATYEKESERFWQLTQQLNPLPTQEEMRYALERGKQIILRGLERSDTAEISRRAMQTLRDVADLNLDFPPNQASVQREPAGLSAHKLLLISARTARRFFEAVLQESGYEGWQVVLDPNASGSRVESGLRQVFLPTEPISLEEIRESLSHEILGHVARSVAGETSLLGLLGIGTKGYMVTEEGIADYHERHVAALHEQGFDDSGAWMSTLAVGLASGVISPPLTFSQLFAFFKPFLLTYRLLWRNDEDLPTAERRAHQRTLTRCLRTFRGVPDLTKAGICFTKDVVYLRGYLQIERAVAEDATTLDCLSVGKVALGFLPDLQELGIVAPVQASALRKRTYDVDLDDYILSFADENENPAPQEQR